MTQFERSVVIADLARIYHTNEETARVLQFLLDRVQTLEEALAKVPA